MLYDSFAMNNAGELNQSKQNYIYQKDKHESKLNMQFWIKFCDKTLKFIQANGDSKMLHKTGWVGDWAVLSGGHCLQFYLRIFHSI